MESQGNFKFTITPLSNLDANVFFRDQMLQGSALIGQTVIQSGNGETVNFTRFPSLFDNSQQQNKPLIKIQNSELDASLKKQEQVLRDATLSFEPYTFPVKARVMVCNSTINMSATDIQRQFSYVEGSRLQLQPSIEPLQMDYQTTISEIVVKLDPTS